ncbi:MAG: hypothetical protein RR853_08805, partial [Aurantimicrobium sp.]|uniref:hypothetical protein n=1 Tax=Aurantimicrobium sp. TaxID=1930784 RepID=UPI00305DDB71
TADQGVTSTQYPLSGTAGTPYTPGATYVFRMVARKVSGTAGAIRIRVGLHGEGQSNNWVLVPGTELSAATAVAGQWVTLTGTYTAPESGNPRDKMSALIHMTSAVGSVFEVAEVSMRVGADAQLIVDGSITGIKVAADSITATHMVAGTITAASGIIANAAIGTAQIANLAVTDAKIGNIDAGKVTTGFLDAARIATNALTARMIAIGDFTNYAAGSDFEDPDFIPWTLPAGFTRSTATANNGLYSLRIQGNFSGSSYLNTKIPIKPGDVFYAEFWMRRSSTWDGGGGNSKLRFGWGNSNASLAYAAVNAPANVWTRRAFRFAIPADATATVMDVLLANGDATTGDCYLDDIVIRKVFGGELLVDGAITARELAVDSVTAEKVLARAITTTKIATNAVTANEIAALTITANEIAANAITATKIAALQIQAGHISANAITADKIDAGAITAIKIDTDAITATKIAATAITSKHTITGARFRTTATANRGIDITSLGLIAYNNSGTPTVVIDAATGDATFIGTIRNRPSGPRVAINSSDTTATIWFYGGAEGGNILPAQITSDPNGQSLFLYGGNPSSTTPIYTVLRLNERTSAVSWLLGRAGYDGAAAYPRISGQENTASFWERSTGHRITMDPNGFTFIVGNGLAIQGQLTTTGAKQFQMDHPTKEGKTLSHASTESPHNGVEYWSDGMEVMPQQGFRTVTLPPYFEALTAPDHRIVLVTPGSPDSNLWVEEILDGKFKVHGTPGAKFSWLVKARRVKFNSDGVDELHFNVEQDMVEPMTPSEPVITAP